MIKKVFCAVALVCVLPFTALSATIETTSSDIPKPSPSMLDLNNAMFRYSMNYQTGSFSEINTLFPAQATKINGIYGSEYSLASRIGKITTGISFQNGLSLLYTPTTTGDIETHLTTITPSVFLQYKVFDQSSWNIFTDTIIGFTAIDIVTYDTPKNGATIRKHYSGSGFNAAIGLGLNYNLYGWNIGIIGDYNIGSASIQGTATNGLLNADLGGTSLRFYIGN